MNNQSKKQNTHFSSEELDIFQRDLERRHQRALEQKDKILQRLSGMDQEINTSQSYGDDSLAEQNKSKLNFLLEKEMRQARQIEAALGRIENKTFGICEVTGKPIDKKRLEQIPFTTVSIEGAQQLEQRNR
jgi:RNA polymerase-binding transcription factor DksA